MKIVLGAALLLAMLSVALVGDLSMTMAETNSPAPLRLETTIALGHVVGRIDHMAIDLTRKRLFVAQLGDNSVGVVDLEARQVAHTIRGLSEPQGVAYDSGHDMVLVAGAGDGVVRSFSGSDYKELGRTALGADADNIRIDPTSGRVLVGYGDGGLAEIDPGSRAKRGEVRLNAHPEGFQLDPMTSRAFVNVPNAREIAVVDYAAGRRLASWPVTDGANFPMAFDPDNRRVVVVFRSPAMLGAFSMEDGKRIARVVTCGDADDVFVDRRRAKVYVSCGDGHVDVFARRDDTYERIAQVPTSAGARTSLFVPELDAYFVAARATPGHQASVLVFKPDGEMTTPAPVK